MTAGLQTTFSNSFSSKKSCIFWIKFQWSFFPRVQIMSAVVNTLRPRQNGRHFPHDIFKCIFLTENIWISLKISLKFVPKIWINNIPALVQIMVWRRQGDKPLSESMMVSLLTQICGTRPQWVKVKAWGQTKPKQRNPKAWVYFMGSTLHGSHHIKHCYGPFWQLTVGSKIGKLPQLHWFPSIEFLIPCLAKPLEGHMILNRIKC